MSRRTATLLAALLASVGCSDVGSVPGEGSFEVRDSAGITVALSRDSLWTSEVAWHVPTTPSVVIGTRDGPDPETLFGRIGGVVVLSDGRIAVADLLAREIRLFSSQGDFIVTFGRSGEGPDEFGFLDRIARIRGDSVIARDVGAFKSVVFSSDGSGYRTVLRPSHVLGRPQGRVCVGLADRRIGVGLAHPPA